MLSTLPHVHESSRPVTQKPRPSATLFVLPSVIRLYTAAQRCINAWDIATFWGDWSVAPPAKVGTSDKDREVSLYICPNTLVVRQ
jgi:hypothetical protein